MASKTKLNYEIPLGKSAKHQILSRKAEEVQKMHLVGTVHEQRSRKTEDRFSNTLNLTQSANFLFRRVPETILVR